MNICIISKYFQKSLDITNSSKIIYTKVYFNLQVLKKIRVKYKIFVIFFFTNLVNQKMTNMKIYFTCMYEML